MSRDGMMQDEGVLKKTEALALYRKLLLARLAEERIRVEYPSDEMKTAVHLGIGGEAIPVGVHHCLPKGTKTFGTYRNHVLYLTVTDNVDGFFTELYGRGTAPAKGKAGSMHMCAPEHGLMATSAVVGTPIPLAVGAALANAYRGVSALAAVFFGDGAMEEGVFWESLNFACLRHLPVLFVCEDNGLAIHTSTAERQGFRSILEAVSGFDCHAAGGDGSDLHGVMASTRHILKRMAEQPKPGFLHLTYLRFLEHVGPNEDFQVGYRRRPTPEEMERLDPVRRWERELLQDGCRPQELQEIRTAMTERISRSVEIAKQAPFPSPDELYTDMLL